MRRIHRPDTVQQEIVEGLRKAGYRVVVIGRPVDLIVGKTHFVGPHKNIIWTNWQPMEIKTPTKTGARRVRRDQEAQDAFIRETGCPVVTSLTSALKVLESL